MDFGARLVWETEGRRGAAERGWLGEREREQEANMKNDAIEVHAEDGKARMPVTALEARRLAEIAHAPAQTTPAIIELALRQKVDTEQLRALMELQEKWEAREAQKAFTRAMAAFKAACPAVLAKDGTVDFTGAKGRTAYRHATLGGICDVVTPHLSAHGLSVGWAATQLDKGLVTVKTTITHEHGHSESVTLCAPRDESGNKNTIQSIGSVCTYLQRYGLLMALGLATSEMDDDGREGPPAPRATKPPAEAKKNSATAERIRKAKALFARYGVTLDQLIASFVGVVPESWTEEQWEQVRSWNRGLKVTPPEDRPALLATYGLAPSGREPGQEG
jgi:hypothetical protein